MKWIVYVLIALALVALAAGTYIATQCPCDRLPGVFLWGDEQAEPVEDWSFVNDTGLCQLQVSGGVLPQSLNLNCMSDAGELFISCSRCEGKRWSATAVAHPAGALRVGTTVYPVTLRRLTAPDELDRAWTARARKIERAFNRKVEGDRPDHWWSFQLSSM